MNVDLDTVPFYQVNVTYLTETLHGRRDDIPHYRLHSMPIDLAHEGSLLSLKGGFVRRPRSALNRTADPLLLKPLLFARHLLVFDSTMLLHR